MKVGGDREGVYINYFYNEAYSQNPRLMTDLISPYKSCLDLHSNI